MYVDIICLFIQYLRLSIVFINFNSFSYFLCISLYNLITIIIFFIQVTIGLVIAPSEAEFTKDAYFANTPVL